MSRLQLVTAARVGFVVFVSVTDFQAWCFTFVEEYKMPTSPCKVLLLYSLFD